MLLLLHRLLLLLLQRLLLLHRLAPHSGRDVDDDVGGRGRWHDDGGRGGELDRLAPRPVL